MSDYPNWGVGPIDMHVHIIGNGSSGSGCWIKLAGWNRILASMMLRMLGLPQDSLHGDFDHLYAEKLVDFVRRSPFKHVTAFAHERVYREDGTIWEGAGSFYVPNDYVFALARKYPEFLPVASIHPARPDALDELERCIERGAVMLKFLANCHNIDCSNPAYKPFWQKMSDHKLPLLAHTGGEMSVQVMNRGYQDPKLLRAPLEQGVTVIAAHVASASHPLDRDYFPDFVQMLREHSNLFGDNSALNSPFRSAVLRKCLGEPVVSRLVHGSDLPIPVSANYAFLRGLLSFRQARTCNSVENILERDLRIKQAIGFPEAVFRRGWDLLRRPASKL